MKTITLTSLIIALFITQAFSQKLSQTVRGTILDTDSKLPLIAATVVIAGTNPTVATITDVNGNFKFQKVPIGRIALQISYMGYSSKTIPDIVVNSGKESVLDISMQESVVKMDEVVVKAYKNKGEAHNDMALLSARSISPEETNRYAGGMDDPNKILSNYAGITSTQDGSNDIIVRGNAPKYIQWRLEGVEITNPSHYDEQNSSSGGYCALNNKLLAASDFYTGAFSPEYGDVLSGVYDVKLRAGNNEKFEVTTGIGLMGLDCTVEGPFKKGYAGSFIGSYRYTALGLLQNIGLINIPGMKTTFQDATFKVKLPTKKMGTFSFFGLNGQDATFVKDIKMTLMQTPGNGQMMPDISQDFDQRNRLGNYGMNHVFTINNNSYLKTSLTYSGTGMNEDVYESTITRTIDDQENINIDTVDRRLNYSSLIRTSTYTGAITYSNKINAKNKIQIGSAWSLNNEENKQSQLEDDATTRFNLLDFNGNITILKNFISLKHNFNDNIALVSGIHNMNVLLNNKSTLEPRIAISWKINNTNSVHAGYGRHSTMERVHNYFTKVELPDGNVSEPNKNLDLLKADHYILGYEKNITENLRAKVEVYYQHLYNLPVENNDTSYYCTINEGVQYRYVPLVNKGSGKNYGIEATLERFFKNHYYFLLNGSLFDSKFKSLDGVERNTKYNNNYLVNILCGKEFDKFGKKQNKTLTLNAKAFFSGGQRYIPLLRDANGNLAVDPANNRFWDYNKAYDKKFDNIFQLNLSVSYKLNNPKATHEIFLSLDNITYNQARLSEFYDVTKPGKINYFTQMPFFPNLMYRVYF